MAILTRSERLGLMGLTIGFLACAVLHMVSPGPSSTCWTPQEFSAEMSSYARHVCTMDHARLYELPSEPLPPSALATKVNKMQAVMKWFKGIPKRLFNAMILVVVPLVFAEILTRIFNVTGANEERLSTSSMVVRSLAELLCRAAFFGCVLAAFFVVKGAPPHLESSTSPRMLLCDFSIRSLSNMHRYTVQCVWSPGQGLTIATTIIHLVKRVLIIVIGWAAIGFVQSVVFIVCPKTRLSFLHSRPKEAGSESNAILHSTLS